ncbi:putative transcription-repair coupling factor, Helicase superfamily, ATP-binding protein [Plasmopara halstedii]
MMPDVTEDEDVTPRFLTKYSVDKLSELWDLKPEICAALGKLKIQSFFPVQAVAIPKILASDSDRVTDICISAPTGSGKTLTYVIPIVQRLLNRIVCRIRALIVLPSRDLALQVHQVVQQFVHNTPLTCGLAIGQRNFAAEQSALVGSSMKDIKSSVIDGGSSLVDILVATPGRLVDHLEQTPGFTLQHLQIMIVDEADRLLNQSYQDWIQKVYASVFIGHLVDDDGLDLGVGVTCRRRDSINRRRIRTPLTRVLLSATLTRNPRKLAAIGMSNAELTKIGRIDDPLADNAKQSNVDEMDNANDENDEVAETTKMYSTPVNLDEYWIECDTGSKPLVLLELLSEFANSLTIVFTASVSSTHRLARLLQLYSAHSERVREFSSNLSQKQRSSLVADCKAGRIQTVVCSDAMARGMDIEDVANVVNYDVPTFIKTYIHRVGRTARAGRHGRCVTLVKMGQMKGMMRMLKKADSNKLKPFPLQHEHMKALVPRYTEALRQLKDTLAAEKTGKLQATAILQKHKVLSNRTSGAEENLMVKVINTDKKRTFSVLNAQLERNLGHRRVRQLQGH